MKKLLLFIFILSAGFAKAQIYTQSIPVDTVIYTGVYSYPGSSCPVMSYPDITLNASLFTYVNGLEFIILVDSVIFPGPMSACPVHVGDTIELNASSPVYSTPAPVIFYFRLKLVGTPITAGQNFPCNLDYLQCTCNCYHMVIQPSIFNTATCTVDFAQKLSSELTQSSLNLYPNPAVNKLSVSGISKKTTIKLYNSLGVLVIEENTDHDLILETSSLPEGMYTLLTSSDESNHGTGKKIVITR